MRRERSECARRKACATACQKVIPRTATGPGAAKRSAATSRASSCRRQPQPGGDGHPPHLYRQVLSSGLDSLAAGPRQAAAGGALSGHCIAIHFERDRASRRQLHLVCGSGSVSDLALSVLKADCLVLVPPGTAGYEDRRILQVLHRLAESGHRVCHLSRRNSSRHPGLCRTQSPQRITYRAALRHQVCGARPGSTGSAHARRRRALSGSAQPQCPTSSCPPDRPIAPGPCHSCSRKPELARPLRPPAFRC